MSKFYTVDRSGFVSLNTEFKLKKNYSDYEIWTVENIYNEKDVIARIDFLHKSSLTPDASLTEFSKLVLLQEV